MNYAKASSFVIYIKKISSFNVIEFTLFPIKIFFFIKLQSFIFYFKTKFKFC